MSEPATQTPQQAAEQSGGNGIGVTFGPVSGVAGYKLLYFYTFALK